jgi:hypothetical protein
MVSILRKIFEAGANQIKGFDLGAFGNVLLDRFNQLFAASESSAPNSSGRMFTEEALNQT